MNGKVWDIEGYIASDPKPQQEGSDFLAHYPYRITQKELKTDDFSTLHYGTTLEIIIVNEIQGTVSIGSSHYKAEKNDVFIIAPNVVHFTVFSSGEGTVHVFKLSFETLGKYVNVDSIFAANGHALEQVPCRLTERYDEICDIIFKRMPMSSNNAFEIAQGALTLFSFLDSCIDFSDNTPSTKKSDRKIRELMKWTQEHMLDNITVDDAAAQMHYSKYYFCRYFKEKTGMTYFTYLNTLKINYAIELMKQGHSTTYCCYECGFENLSYFIQLFKEITGYTTNEYRQKLKISSDNDGEDS